MPETLICWGLVLSLSKIRTTPLNGPFCPGEKVTEIVQLAWESNELPQVFVSEKLESAEIRGIVSAASPVFVTEIVRAALVVPTACAGNVRLDGTTFTAETVAVSGTVSGPPALVSTTTRDPGLFPETVGFNVTVILQDCCGARLFVQEVVCE